MKTRSLIALSGLIFVSMAQADSVSIHAGAAGSTNDLFQAATVTASSGIAGVTDPAAAFGTAPQAYERGTVIALDNTTGRIEFNPGMVTAGEFVFELASDGNTLNRSSDAVRLYADTGSGWELVAEANPLRPYHVEYGSSVIHAIVTIDTPVTADKWAVEWDSIPGLFGARIREVDAYAPAEEPSGLMIIPAVEIGYATVSGEVYKVQYASSLSSTNWFDLSSTVVGDGSTNYVFDTTRESSERFYRVLVE